MLLMNDKKTVKLFGTQSRWFCVKTLLSIVLAALLVFSMTGCSSDPDDSTTTTGEEEGKGKDDDDPFIPVSSITLAKNAVKLGETLTLSGTVVPTNANNKDITWSVSASQTKVSLSGSTITSKSDEGTGVVSVIATVTDGSAAGKNFTQRFDIIISKTLDANGNAPNPFKDKTYATAGSGSASQNTTLNNMEIVLGIPGAVDALLSVVDLSSVSPIPGLTPEMIAQLPIIQFSLEFLDASEFFMEAGIPSADLSAPALGVYQAYVGEDDAYKVRLAGEIAQLGAAFDMTGTLDETTKIITFTNTENPSTTNVVRITEKED